MIEMFSVQKKDDTSDEVLHHSTMDVSPNRWCLPTTSSFVQNVTYNENQYSVNSGSADFGGSTPPHHDDDSDDGWLPVGFENSVVETEVVSRGFKLLGVS